MGFSIRSPHRVSSIWQLLFNLYGGANSLTHIRRGMRQQARGVIQPEIRGFEHLHAHTNITGSPKCLPVISLNPGGTANYSLSRIHRVALSAAPTPP